MDVPPRMNRSKHENSQEPPSNEMDERKRYTEEDWAKLSIKERIRTMKWDAITSGTSSTESSSVISEESPSNIYAKMSIRERVQVMNQAAESHSIPHPLLLSSSKNISSSTDTKKQSTLESERLVAEPLELSDPLPEQVSIQVEEVVENDESLSSQIHEEEALHQEQEEEDNDSDEKDLNRESVTINKGTQNKNGSSPSGQDQSTSISFNLSKIRERRRRKNKQKSPKIQSDSNISPTKIPWADSNTARQRIWSKRMNPSDTFSNHQVEEHESSTTDKNECEEAKTQAQMPASNQTKFALESTDSFKNKEIMRRKISHSPTRRRLLFQTAKSSKQTSQQQNLIDAPTPLPSHFHVDESKMNDGNPSVSIGVGNRVSNPLHGGDSDFLDLSSPTSIAVEEYPDPPIPSPSHFSADKSKVKNEYASVSPVVDNPTGTQNSYIQPISYNHPQGSPPLPQENKMSRQLDSPDMRFNNVLHSLRSTSPPSPVSPPSVVRSSKNSILLNNRFTAISPFPGNIPGPINSPPKHRNDFTSSYAPLYTFAKKVENNNTNIRAKNSTHDNFYRPKSFQSVLETSVVPHTLSNDSTDTERMSNVSTSTVNTRNNFRSRLKSGVWGKRNKDDTTLTDSSTVDTDCLDESRDASVPTITTTTTCSLDEGVVEDESTVESIIENHEMKENIATIQVIEPPTTTSCAGQIFSLMENVCGFGILSNEDEFKPNTTKHPQLKSKSKNKSKSDFNLIDTEIMCGGSNPSPSCLPSFDEGMMINNKNSNKRKKNKKIRPTKDGPRSLNVKYNSSNRTGRPRSRNRDRGVVV